MSTSRELVDRLLADGMSKAEIAREIGRDSSVISQITSGRKPYANLTPTLEAMERNRRGQTVPIPEAPRRLDKTGHEAAVRRPTGRGRTVSVRSPGAIKSGAKSVRNRLKKAADEGMMTAWTVVYPVGTGVGKSGGGSNHHKGSDDSNVAIFRADADDISAAVEEAGGDVGAGVTNWLVAQNMLDTPNVKPVSIEIRTYYED